MEHHLEFLKKCPICETEDFQKHLELNDYFLSQEAFIIQKCVNCSLLFTNPRPAKERIGSYYLSENYISHSNSKKGFFASLYQFARKVNLASKYAIIKKHIKTGNALDIGSGTGHFLNYLNKKRWNIQGIEPNKDAADFARENFKLEINNESKLGEFENGFFDLVTMWHVLEHVHDLNERLAQIHRILNTKGLLIIALPNHESYDSKYYVKYWAGYDVPRHLYHFSKDDVFRLAEKHNFRVENIVPMKLDSFYVSFLSEKYKRANGCLIRTFFIALLSNLKNTSKNPNSSSLIYLLRPIEA